MADNTDYEENTFGNYFNIEALDVDPFVKKKVEDEINRLKREREQARDRCYEAGIYGRNLLEEKQQLALKLDQLKQDKYELSQKLALKESQDMNRTTDVDTLQEQVDKGNELIKNMKIKEKELQKKIDIFKEQVKESENREEELKVKLIEEKQLTEELQKQNHYLKEREKEYNISLESTCNNSQDCDYETLKTKNGQIMSVYLKSQDLLKEKEVEVESLRLDVETLRCELDLKSQKIYSLSTLLEEYKTELEELKLEVECNKASQIDVNKRGNCIFAEVEDHRVLLEKKLFLETEKCKQLSTKLNAETEKVAKQNAQIKTLLFLNGQNDDKTRIRELESNLKCAFSEITLLQSKLNTAAEESTQAKGEGKMSSLYISKDCDDINLQLHHLNLKLNKEREEVNKREREIKALNFNLAVHKEQLHDVGMKYHSSQLEIKALKCEILKLKQQLSSLRRKKNDSSEESKEKENLTLVEKIPDINIRDSESFHPETIVKPRSSILSKNTFDLLTISPTPSEKHVNWCEAVDKQQREKSSEEPKLKHSNKSLNNKPLRNKEMESVTECKQQ